MLRGFDAMFRGFGTKTSGFDTLIWIENKKNLAYETGSFYKI